MNERYQQSRNDGRVVPYDEWQRRMGPVDPTRDSEWQRGSYYGDQQARQDSWREPMRAELVRTQQDGSTEWMGTQGRTFDQPNEWSPQQGRTFSRQPGVAPAMHPFDQQIGMQPQGWFGTQGTWGPPYPQRGPSQPERWTGESERWTTPPQQLRGAAETPMQLGWMKPVPMHYGPMPYAPMSYGPMQPAPMSYGPMLHGQLPYGPLPMQYGPLQQGMTAGGMMPRPQPWRDQELASYGYRGRGPRNYQRSDERIREDICDILLQDHLIDASQIEVEVTRGDVTLTGKVADRWEKFRAEDISASIPGVRDVTNQLKVEELDTRTSDDGPASAGRTTKGSRTTAAG